MEGSRSLARRVRARLATLTGVAALEVKVEAQAAQLGQLREAHHETSMMAGHGVAVASDASHHASEAMAAARSALDGTERLPSILDSLHDHEQRLSTDERLASIIRTMAWLELLGPESAGADVSVSVVMPTFNRGAMVSRAVGSVLAQSHSRWELLIGDDGSDDDTPKVLDAFAADDERIRTFVYEHAGSSTVRNRLLGEATGDVITYLDDDNLMAPGWLKAVAWCFGDRADVDVAYGARLIENPERLWGELHAGSSVPWIQFDAYDRNGLEHGNTIDMGCIAHRRGVPEARLDERLHRLADWDLVLRLTASRPPFELPALAGCYLTDAPQRRSDEIDEGPERTIVLAKLGGASPRR